MEPTQVAPAAAPVFSVTNAVADSTKIIGRNPELNLDVHSELWKHFRLLSHFDVKHGHHQAYWVPFSEGNIEGFKLVSRAKYNSTARDRHAIKDTRALDELIKRHPSILISG